MKRDKFVKKALETLELAVEGEVIEGIELNTEKDLDAIISEFKTLIISGESNIEQLKDSVKNCKEQLEILQTIKHQIKVEEYKELNPRHKVF